MAGILLIAWVPLAVGFHRAHVLRDRARLRQELVALLTELAGSVRLARRPPAELLTQLARRGRCAFLEATDETDTVIDCFLGRVDATLRDADTTRRLQSLFALLAQTDATGARDALQAAVCAFSKAAEAAVDISRKKAPLCRKLGALASLLLFILLL